MIEWITTMDKNIILYIQENFHNAVTDFIFPKITFFGNGGWIWILAIVLMLIFKKTRKWGLVMAVAMIVCSVLNNEILKNLVDRPRPCHDFPYIDLLIARPTSFSFPSGHSATSFVSAVTIYKMNRKWGIAAIIFAALIAFSRVFLFVHYPSDVLVGSLLGAAISLVICAVLKKFKKLPQRV